MLIAPNMIRIEVIRFNNRFLCFIATVSQFILNSTSYLSFFVIQYDRMQIPENNEGKIR